MANTAPAKRTSANTQGSSFSSLVNFVTNPFRRGDDEDKSISGSEDEWNGEPPSAMKGQDVFSLAAAAGRRGEDFEARAEVWRQGKGALRGSRSVSVSS